MKFRFFFMMARKWLLAFSALLLLPAGASGEEAGVFTLWPIFDYRRSDAADYTSIGVGPLLKYERKGEERTFALRPLYYRGWDPEAAIGFSEILYPIASSEWSKDVEAFQGLRLLSSDFGEREMGSANRFMLFPFLFFSEAENKERSFAFFPFGGRIRDQLGQDEIRFALFPLYSRTSSGERTTTHYLWPVFSLTEGDGETGMQFWPLFGGSEKTGVYRKRFFLWPVFATEQVRLDTDDPESRIAIFPFYIRHDSPAATATTVLWPLFSHSRNRLRATEEWNLPWPLVRFSSGDQRAGGRILPFYADERAGAVRKRWFFWPVYKIEELQTGAIDRRRDRILFFLYSHLQEEKPKTGARLKRVALWPLFTWEEKNGITSLHSLSLLEPFFPDSAGIRRNWAPLWHLYELKADSQGNEISSLFWNFYWKERRGEDLAVELFPFFFYRREEGKGKDLRLLKGLVRYRTDEGRRRLNFLFLPWSLDWGQEMAPETEGETP